MPTEIALQLYTLRQFTKTPDDIARTLARVKKMGYDAVQVSAIGKIEPQKLANILKNEGLACCATHMSLERMRDETAAVIAEHQLYGCKYAAIGGTGYKDMSAEKWQAFIDEYNGIAKKFQGTGVQLGYHNHSHELVRYGDKRPLDMMLEKFDKSIWMEIDVYWITQGGGDPSAWIDRCSGRIPCVHWKDMSVEPDRTQKMREVGEGNLNWPGILKACRSAGVEWYIIEQDDCNGMDPFECAERSLRNVKAMGLS